VNMIFNTAARRYASQPGTEYLMESECGRLHAGDDRHVCADRLRDAALPPDVRAGRTADLALQPDRGGVRRRVQRGLDLQGSLRHVCRPLRLAGGVGVPGLLHDR
jgi:hypothetical protein